MAASSMWSDLPRRLTTISLGVPIILYILSYRATALLFFQGVHLLSCLEWIRLVPTAPSSTIEGSCNYYLFVICSMTVAQLSPSLFPLGMMLAMAFLYLLSTGKQAYHFLHGLLLITWPFHVWYQVSQNFSHTVSLLFIVWNCDTGALVAGRLRKMLFSAPPKPIPWLHTISPAKSLAGMVGGILLGTLTTLCIPSLLNATQQYLPGNGVATNTKWWQNSPWDTRVQRVLMGILLSLLAILGDLVESKVKRQAGKKDASKLLPGHGGVLDRFDSSLLAVVLYRCLCMTTPSNL